MRGEVLNHKFIVLRSPEPTVILGRDFLTKYASTEFDRTSYRIRLGDFWLNSDTTITGGHALFRAELVERPTAYQVSSIPQAVENEWNINPEIDPRQQSRINKLLEEFRDVFADNHEKPSITTHSITHAYR